MEKKSQVWESNFIFKGNSKATVEVMTLKRCNTLASLQALEKLWLALMLILLHTLENHVWAYLTGIFSIVVTSLDQDSCYTPKQNTSGEAVFINSSKIQLDLSFYYGHVNKFKASQVRIPIWSKLFKTDLKTLHIRHTCSFSLKPVCILSRLEENIFFFMRERLISKHWGWFRNESSKVSVFKEQSASYTDRQENLVIWMYFGI